MALGGLQRRGKGLTSTSSSFCFCAQQCCDLCWPEALFFPLPLFEDIFAEGKKRRKTVGSVPGTSTYKPQNQVAIVGCRENREPLFLKIHSTYGRSVWGLGRGGLAATTGEGAFSWLCLRRSNKVALLWSRRRLRVTVPDGAKFDKIVFYRES